MVSDLIHTYHEVSDEQKKMFAQEQKLIVVSEINNVELEELIHTILEKGIEEQGFYE